MVNCPGVEPSLRDEQNYCLSVMNVLRGHILYAKISCEQLRLGITMRLDTRVSGRMSSYLGNVDMPWRLTDASGITSLLPRVPREKRNA